MEGNNNSLALEINTVTIPFYKTKNKSKDFLKYNNVRMHHASNCSVFNNPGYALFVPSAPWAF